MILVTTLVSYRAFVPARSEGTKENIARWQVRLDSRQDDRGWLGVGYEGDLSSQYISQNGICLYIGDLLLEKKKSGRT